MKFQQGNKFSKGGRKGRAGRPTKAQAEAKRLAADAAKKYLEDKLKAILDVYIAGATGGKVGKKKYKLDPATTRHAVERFVGPAPRSLILDLQETVESFFEEMEKMGK